MIQQINLYQDIVRQGHHKSFVNPYATVIIALILSLICFSLYLYLGLRTLNSNVEMTRKNLAIESAKLTDLQARFPKYSLNPALPDQIKLLESKILELTQTIHFLTDSSSTSRQGFSGHFQALSNQALEDVWLTRIFISGLDSIVNIEGSTLSPEQIPQFLQQLQKEPIFNGQTFAKLTMVKSDKFPKQINFKLNTATENNDKNHD